MSKDGVVRLFVSQWCAECERAVALLERHGVPFEAVDLGDADNCCRLHELTGGASVPQAVVDGRPIGGYDELVALVRSGLPGPAGRRVVWFGRGWYHKAMSAGRQQR